MSVLTAARPMAEAALRAAKAQEFTSPYTGTTFVPAPANMPRPAQPQAVSPGYLQTLLGAFPAAKFKAEGVAGLDQQQLALIRRVLGHDNIVPAKVQSFSLEAGGTVGSARLAATAIPTVPQYSPPKDAGWFGIEPTVQPNHASPEALQRVRAVLGDDAARRYALGGAQGLTSEERSRVLLREQTREAARAPGELTYHGGIAQVLGETLTGTASDVKAGISSAAETAKQQAKEVAREAAFPFAMFALAAVALWAMSRKGDS